MGRLPRVVLEQQQTEGREVEGACLVPGDYSKAFNNAAKRIKHAHNITLRDLRHCFVTYSTLSNDLVATQAVTRA